MITVNSFNSVISVTIKIDWIHCNFKISNSLFYSVIRYFFFFCLSNWLIQLFIRLTLLLLCSSGSESRNRLPGRGPFRNAIEWNSGGSRIHRHRLHRHHQRHHQRSFVANASITFIAKVRVYDPHPPTLSVVHSSYFIIESFNNVDDDCSTSSITDLQSIHSDPDSDFSFNNIKKDCSSSFITD